MLFATLQAASNICARRSVLLRGCLIRTMSMGDRQVQEGDELPNVSLYENSPANKVELRKLCEGKKCIIFAVPGAFTPGCSKSHLPGYVSKADAFKQKGIGEIICISVNDPFVMEAWGIAQKAEGKVRLLADPDASYTKSLGLAMDLPPLGGIRSKRYSMLVENNIIKGLHVEPDGTGLSCSLADNVESKF